MGCETLPSDVTVDYGSTNSARPRETLSVVSRLSTYVYDFCMYGFLFVGCLVALILFC